MTGPTMQSLARMLSRASSAEDDLAYLTKTMPFAAIRSILQYSRSLNFDISPCIDSAFVSLSCQVQACTVSVKKRASRFLAELCRTTCLKHGHKQMATGILCFHQVMYKLKGA